VSILKATISDLASANWSLNTGASNKNFESDTVNISVYVMHGSV